MDDYEDDKNSLSIDNFLSNSSVNVSPTISSDILPTHSVRFVSPHDFRYDEIFFSHPRMSNIIRVFHSPLSIHLNLIIMFVTSVKSPIHHWMKMYWIPEWKARKIFPDGISKVYTIDISPLPYVNLILRLIQSISHSSSPKCFLIILISTYVSLVWPCLIKAFLSFIPIHLIIRRKKRKLLHMWFLTVHRFIST